MGKVKFLVGFGVGYVLGTRAGHERYDQITGAAQRLWRNPRVQHKVEDARYAAGKAAEQAGGVVADKAGQAQDAVKEQASQLQDVVKEKASSGSGLSGQRYGVG